MLFTLSVKRVKLLAIVGSGLSINESGFQFKTFYS